MKISDLSKKTNLSKHQLRGIIRRLRLPVSEHAKKIENKWVDRIEEYLAEQTKPTEEDAQKKEVTKTISIPPRITVKDFAERLDLNVTEVIGELLKNGIVANINESIDFETAAIISEDLGAKVKKSTEQDSQETGKLSAKQLRELIVEKNEKDLKPRPPIVVITGHVDHGKTTLLDAIRETNVVSGEAGGITQHIGAYQVVKKSKKITFLDTPGHEAFSAMRQRGTAITDIAILVVAANDGVKPQTIEAINFAKAAGIPIIVAINKIDLPDADPDRVKKELSEHNVLTEEWGGDTIAVEISAKQKKNLDKLLDMILLVAEVQELKANPHRPAVGTIIEANIDKKEGVLASALILAGTLRVGDQITAGTAHGTVRNLKDFLGRKIQRALPSDPVQIFGLNKAPEAGDTLMVEVSKRAASAKAKEIKELEKIRRFSKASIKQAQEKDDKVSKLPIIIKADVQGSLEAITQTLQAMGTKEVIVSIVREGAGDVTESDVMTAGSTHAAILAFGVKIAPVAKRIAEKEKIIIKTFDVIYDLVEEIKKDMAALLPKEIVRTDLGKIKILAIFRNGKGEMIAGGRVTSGKAVRGGLVEIIREGEKIGTGKLSDLQQNKKRVEEVKSGNEAGFVYTGKVKLQEGDEVKIFKEEQKTRHL